MVKILVYLFLIFLCVIIYIFGMAIRRKHHTQPSKRKMFANGLIARQRDEEDEWNRWSDKY